MIFDIEARDAFDGPELLSWPHWLLKLLYLEVEIMVGKFWRGEVSHDKLGRVVPIPPVDFLSIRTAVKPKDVRFFAGQVELLPGLSAGIDDGRSCFEKIGLDARAFRAMERVACEVAVDPAQSTTEDALRWAADIVEAGVYEGAIEWAQNTHPI